MSLPFGLEASSERCEGPEVRDQRAGGRKSEARGQMSEVGDQRAEDGGPEVRGPQDKERELENGPKTLP
jgi:hypothetical protein